MMPAARTHSEMRSPATAKRDKLATMKSNLNEYHEHEFGSIICLLGLKYIFADSDGGCMVKQGEGDANTVNWEWKQIPPWQMSKGNYEWEVRPVTNKSVVSRVQWQESE